MVFYTYGISSLAAFDKRRCHPNCFDYLHILSADNDQCAMCTKPSNGGAKANLLALHGHHSWNIVQGSAILLGLVMLQLEPKRKFGQQRSRRGMDSMRSEKMKGCRV